MPSELVRNWFGGKFNDLHPLLQKLHLEGGNLEGEVEIAYGQGLAGMIGGRLAKKMNLPEAGTHQLVVSISHDRDGLHWGRSFNNENVVLSVFKPVGSIDNGHWVETTGPLTMHLTVDVNNGGWYWRCRKVRFLGVPVPIWLIPKTNAYKVIEEGQYRFHVEFSLPVVGSLVSYQGLLSTNSD